MCYTYYLYLNHLYLQVTVIVIEVHKFNVPHLNVSYSGCLSEQIESGSLVEETTGKLVNSSLHSLENVAKSVRQDPSQGWAHCDAP
jgi:hypothetical protein